MSAVVYTITAKNAQATRAMQDQAKAEKQLEDQTKAVGKAAEQQGYAVEQSMKKMGKATDDAVLKFKAASGKIKGYGVTAAVPTAGTTYAAGLAARPFVAGT